MNKEFFVSTFREWRLYIETFLKWLVIASLIGGAGGLIGAIFHHSIDMAEVFRSTHPWLLWLLPLCLLQWGVFCIRSVLQRRQGRRWRFL